LSTFFWGSFLLPFLLYGPPKPHIIVTTITELRRILAYPHKNNDKFFCLYLYPDTKTGVKIRLRNQPSFVTHYIKKPE
jgi:hypothetical protein